MDPEKFHKIDENLISNEVAQLKFLCMDLIPKKRLETVNDAKELFIRLDEQSLLDDSLLVPELLITIGRLDLLGIIETSKDKVEKHRLQCDPSIEGVSAYRKMLFSLSEDMTEENLRAVKFLVELPKAKLGTSATFLDVMIEMEKLQKLGEDNLDYLHYILDQCDKQLASRVAEYMRKVQGGRLPLREVSGNVHVSIPNQMETENGWTGSSLLTDSDTESRNEEYYKLDQRPLGYCLIINNYKFKEGSKLSERVLSDRRGTDKDRDDLTTVFRKMHFKVEVRNDQTASEMKDVIRQFAKEDHGPMGAFVCCVLSHGEKGTVFGVDGKEVDIREFTVPIAECRTLISKPKLFFIQACQGNEAQNGVLAPDAPGNEEEEEPFEEDAYNPAARYVPIEADMLIGMATVEHYQSYRHTTQGSIYIQELCRQLQICCPRKEDILSILTKVNHEVSLKMLGLRKQMPEPRYTLTKKVVLPWTEASD